MSEPKVETRCPECGGSGEIILRRDPGEESVVPCPECGLTWRFALGIPGPEEVAATMCENEFHREVKPSPPSRFDKLKCEALEHLHNAANHVGAASSLHDEGNCAICEAEGETERAILALAAHARSLEKRAEEAAAPIIHACGHAESIVQIRYYKGGRCEMCVQKLERERNEARAEASFQKERADNNALQADAEVKEARAEVERLTGALREISKGEGTFRRDRLEHAENTIAHLKTLACDALYKEGGRDGE